MTWTLLHTIASLALTCVTIFMLTRWREKYIFVERFGLGLAGGAGMLRINTIWELQASPFFEWGPTLTIIGLLLFLSGRAWREFRHEIVNWQANRQAYAHHKARGRF